MRLAVQFVSKRFTIIDGYNVLHVNGFIASPVGPGTLEKARNLLLGMLARHLDAPTRQRTTVVFDSREAALPNRMTAHEMLVEFASEYASADDLIATLVRKHSAPKQLTVVSSDHQIQRVARSRGARAIDSDQWLDSLTSLAKPDTDATVTTNEKPESLRGKIDIEYWKDQMGLDESFEEILDSTENQIPASRPEEEPPEIPDADFTFPPGYADDLFEEEQ